MADGAECEWRELLMTDYLTNDADLKKVADAIRAKGGTTDPLVFPDGFSAAVGAISTAPDTQEKAVTITENGTTSVTPDEGKVLSKVDVTVNVPATPTEEKTVLLNMMSGNQVVTPSTGKVLTKVTVQKPSTLVSENIKKDVSIGGVTGSLEAAVPAKELNYEGVNFISWDGTVVETWTLEELAAATEQPALPTMPSIDSMSRWRGTSTPAGLALSIADGDEATAELQRVACWNSTLADLKSWAAPAIVGVCYGDHIQQTVTDAGGNDTLYEIALWQRLAPILIVVDVNETDGMTVTLGDFLGTTSSTRAQVYSWGDGSNQTTVTGAKKTHTYTAPGRYVIQIGTYQNVSLGNGYIQGTLMSAKSAPLVKGIIFPFASEAAATTGGNNGPNQFVSFAQNVFEGCSRLKTLAFSPNCIYTGGSGTNMYMFTGCYGLETISIPLTTVIHEGEKMNIISAFLTLEASPQQDYALSFVVFPTGDKYHYNGRLDVQGVYQLECLCMGVSPDLLSDAAVTVAGVGFSRYLSLRVIDLRKYTTGVLALSIMPSGAKLWPMAGGKPLQIKVPAALVDQYKADSDWSAYADYIVGV